MTERNQRQEVADQIDALVDECERRYETNIIRQRGQTRDPEKIAQLNTKLKRQALRLDPKGKYDQEEAWGYNRSQ